MFKQLRDWMICGHLNDQFEEFYIYLDKNNTTGNADSTSQDDDFLMLKSLTGFNLNSINEVEELFIGARFSSNYSQYTLSSTKLPSYINLKCANKILFTGELLQLFQVKFLNDINSDETLGNLSVLDATASSVNSLLANNKTQFNSEFEKCKF